MITSASNQRLKLVRKLRGRKARERLGLFVCEGEDLVASGLDAGLEPADVLFDGSRSALTDRVEAKRSSRSCLPSCPSSGTRRA